MKTNLSAIVNKKVIKEAKSNKSVPTPKKVVNKQAKIVCVSPFKTNLKDQSKKSPAKQTPKKKKKKSSEHPDSGKSPRRSSPRFKNTPEEPHNAEKTSQNSSEEPHDAEKTTPTRSSARKTESEVEPVAEKTTPTRSSLRKRKSSFEPEQSQPLQSTSGASQVAPSSEVVKKQKYAKRRLYTGPCPNVQVRNVNDTFSDLQDSEDEEDEDDEQEEKGNEEVENENVENEDEENEDEENENDGEDHGVENENETEAQAKPKRKYVPRGPTRMSALGLTNGKNGKEVVSFNNKDHPIGDPSVQLASVLGVMVRRNIALKHRDWRRVPKEAKDNIWAVVQQRFVVNEFYKDYYVGKMGCYLKEARSRKFGKILALDELEKEEREKKLAALKPDNSTVNEWEEFVKHVCSEEFRTKRFWMQQIRKKYTTPHTISRLGWARLEAKMQKERKTQEQIDRVEVWTTGHKQKE